MSSMLLDVNVWLALAYGQHDFHERAQRWFDQQADGTLHFCRITQISFVRLLTTRKFVGSGVLTQRGAWKAYQQLRDDPRVMFLQEPVGVEEAFRLVADREEISPKRWNDDYLIAFAEIANLTVVTFDLAVAARAKKSIFIP